MEMPEGIAAKVNEDRWDNLGFKKQSLNFKESFSFPRKSKNIYHLVSKPVSSD